MQSISNAIASALSPLLQSGASTSVGQQLVVMAEEGHQQLVLSCDFVSCDYKLKESYFANETHHIQMGVVTRK